MWSDEADTAVLASNIVKFGVPKAWDGVTFTDSDLGARVNDDLVMVSHPWLQYYVTAASFLVFGHNTFTARLPFALAGWLTFVVAYWIVWKTVADRRAAFSTAALLAFSPQFFLYCRQCRNYSLNMLLSVALLATFLRMRSVWQAAIFAVTAILLFHTHPIGIVSVAALGVLTVVCRQFAAQRQSFWLAAPVICLFTLPWFVLAKSGYDENAASPANAGEFFVRCGQYVIECASVTPLIGMALTLLVIAIFRVRGTRNNQATPVAGEKNIQFCALVIVLSYVFAMAISQPSHAMWIVGVRYTPAVIPLVAMCAGILITRTTTGRHGVWIALLFVFCLTKLAYLAPWLSQADPTSTLSEVKLLEPHIPLRAIDCFINTDEILVVRDLWKENRGTVSEVTDFLATYAGPGDHMIANVDCDSLYFHTHLAQNLKILPGYPVRDRARRKGLPEYVFNVGRPRWVVWRPFWEGTDGYNWLDVQQEIESGGGRMSEVAALNETVWENRENIHFRRYAGGRHLFSGFENLPRGGIFRVDWD